uniref:Uncharacterized protein LOC111125833 isoform X3 n=1 Tax=Crassostrea virginica TaxID=6565 RepID=A0A8B8DC78_CRAVI|nr:uncharacterized protein LOC111125833 isoform X3 [Crassostrea virginica]
MCKFSGFSTATSNVVTQETNPVAVTYTVKPRVIEMPRVRILGEFSDTPARQFPMATALQLTCEGQVGNDASKTIRWCARKSTDFIFTGLPQTPIHSEASLIGCQYTRSSTITYNLTSTDTFTQFLCESGDTGMCGTGSVIQYVNITVESSNVGNPTTNTRTADAFPQNIQIQVLPKPVIYQENDLVIQCSITNPSQLSSVFYIQLHHNSSTGFETTVSIFKDQNPQIQWPSGSTLQNRASALGSEINTPSTAKLKLTIDKNSVMCPTDFTAYRCKLSGFSSAESDAVTQESNPVTVTYTVKPKVIGSPSVKILGEPFDTQLRQFPVATALQLTCEGDVGNDESKTIRWCARKSTDFIFTGLPQTPIHSEASLLGCQYTRSSTITYNLTSTDIFTQFLCESGENGMCGTGSAIQYVNITVESSNEGNPTTNTRTADETSDAGIIAGGVIGGLAALILIILLVYFLVLRRKTDGETYRTKEEVPGYNGPANPEGPVYSVPVKDHPPERQELLEEEREEDNPHDNGTALQGEPRGNCIMLTLT